MTDDTRRCPRKWCQNPLTWSEELQSMRCSQCEWVERLSEDEDDD